MLHERAGTPSGAICELCESIRRLQCSAACCTTLWPVDSAILDRLRNYQEWVPRCPVCNDACLRPNVIIFYDSTLVDGSGSIMDTRKRLVKLLSSKSATMENFVVIKVGAGVVVPTIRFSAAYSAAQGRGLARINPSADECEALESGGEYRGGIGKANNGPIRGKYFSLVKHSIDALRALAVELS